MSILRCMRGSRVGCIAIILSGLLNASAMAEVDSPPRPIERPELLPLVHPGTDAGTEVAIYEIRIEGDARPTRAESLLSGVRYDAHEHVVVASHGAGAVSALHWRFFHTLFEGRKSYQLKASEFFVLDRTDLQPYKWSKSWDSWEGGGCCLLRLRGAADSLIDPNGNVPAIPLRDGFYPAALIPLLVRALDFRNKSHHDFETRTEGGTTFAVRAVLVGREEIRLADGRTRSAEKIVVRYRQPEDSWVPRLIFATHGDEEVYWRGTTRDRLLLRLDTRYYARALSMVLVGDTRRDYHRQTLPAALRPEP